MSSDLCSKRIAQSARWKVGGVLAARAWLGTSCSNPAGESGISDQNEGYRRGRKWNWLCISWWIRNRGGGEKNVQMSPAIAVSKSCFLRWGVCSRDLFVTGTWTGQIVWFSHGKFGVLNVEILIRWLSEVRETGRAGEIFLRFIGNRNHLSPAPTISKSEPRWAKAQRLKPGRVQRVYYREAIKGGWEHMSRKSKKSKETFLEISQKGVSRESHYRIMP